MNNKICACINFTIFLNVCKSLHMQQVHANEETTLGEVSKGRRRRGYYSAYHAMIQELAGQDIIKFKSFLLEWIYNHLFVCWAILSRRLR